MIAPRGWDQLPPLLASRVEYLAWVSERIPDPYPPNTVFHRWHDRLSIAELISAHRPEEVAVLAWGDAKRFGAAVAEATRSGIQTAVAETATARLPERVENAVVIDVRCFPSVTGDDPLSKALAARKLFLPESAADIPVSCPSAEEVAGALLGEDPAGFEQRSPRPLVDILHGVDVRLIPDGVPSVAAMALARLAGALYWPLSVWSEYQVPEEVDTAREEQRTSPDSIDSRGGR